MRKKTIIFGLIEIALIIYTYVAWSNTRGLRIYLISYQMGKIFTFSYLPIALIAVIGLFVVIKLLKKDLKIIKENRVQKKAKNAPVQVQQNTSPAQAVPVPNSVTVANTKDEPQNNGTVNLDTLKATYAQSDEDATIIDEETTKQASTIETETSEAKDVTPENRLKYCPNCGTVVEEGQKFCKKCGTKI